MGVKIDQRVGPSHCTSPITAAGDLCNNGPLSLPSHSSILPISDDPILDEIVEALLDLKNGGVDGGGMLSLPCLPATAKKKRTPRVLVGTVKTKKMKKSARMKKNKKKNAGKKPKPLKPPKICVYESIRLVAPLKLRIKIASSASASSLQFNPMLYYQWPNHSFNHRGQQGEKITEYNDLSCTNGQSITLGLLWSWI